VYRREKRIKRDGGVRGGKQSDGRIEFNEERRERKEKRDQERDIRKCWEKRNEHVRKERSKSK
jgi:hypothetical protein